MGHPHELTLRVVLQDELLRERTALGVYLAISPGRPPQILAQ